MGTLNVSDRRLGFTKSRIFVISCLLTDRAWICEHITKPGANKCLFFLHNFTKVILFVTVFGDIGVIRKVFDGI